MYLHAVRGRIRKVSKATIHKILATSHDEVFDMTLMMIVEIHAG